MRVAVISGGRSSEREVSLHTGEQVAGAICSLGHEAIIMEADQSLPEQLLDVHPDLAYIALHGRYGEDGTMQGLLELMGVPYVGSGVLASALGMDKVMSKRLFRLAGVPVPGGMTLSRAQLEESDRTKLLDRLLSEVGLPFVVKPNTEGSTVGVTIVRGQEEAWPALTEAFVRDETVLVEEYIEGVEITVAVLGNARLQALPVIEIVPKRAFYDYTAKYTPGLSEHVIPARISPEAAAKAQEYAVTCYQALGCRGFARVDLIVRRSDDSPIVLEINTLPGMTSTSLVPDAARAVGMEFPQLIERLLLLALNREA